jgi:hypothetical protein
MSSIHTLGVIAAWFVLGMARIVFTSRMVELRIDNPDPSEAMAFTWQAAKRRVNAANYDPQGQRVLPWYRAVITTCWIVVTCACGWAAYFG